MSMDNIQLKQESVMNENQTVLSDINPITNTESVDDSASGEKLNMTIVRMWEAINNKLSRVVNSVNGRTGVVVLTSDDVGLGNVDNVSFYDIKQWVIDQIESSFGNKQLRLYTSFDEVLQEQATNDQALSWSPFYCDHYDTLVDMNSDLRPVIGFYGWDSGAGVLTIYYKKINAIAFSDNSIIYRQTSGDYGAEKGIPIGGIGVNIYQEENPDEDQVLSVVEGTDKAHSGLRIDRDKLGSRVYYCETPYGYVLGKDQPNWDFSLSSDAMLWRYGTDESKKGYRVKIFINDYQIEPKYTSSTQINSTSEVVGDGFYINTDWENYSHLRVNDIIIMRFDNFIQTTNIDDPAVDYNAKAPESGICIDFSNRQPMIGYVSKSENNTADFVIKFFDLHPNTHGYGIKSYPSLLDRDEPDTVLGINVITSNTTPTNTETDIDVNMSGVNAQYEYDNGSFASEANRSTVRKDYKPIKSHTPWGVDIDYPLSNGGMAVQTDESLCVQAEYQRYPTRKRQWFAPTFIANKFYSKSGDVYTVLETEPEDWVNTWGQYYTQNQDGETYSQVVGIPPTYSTPNYSKTEYGGIQSEQRNIGSLLSRNYSYARTNNGTKPYSEWWGIHAPAWEPRTYYAKTGEDVYTLLETIPNDWETNYSDYYFKKYTNDESFVWTHVAAVSNGTLDIEHPLGSDPKDGLVGTKSELSLNLAKISTVPTDVPNGKYGYLFYNLSGLRLMDAFNAWVATDYGDKFPTSFYHEIGMPDMKDAYGKSVKNVFTTGGRTSGVSVNTGRFLEITPKKTNIAEKYWDGGKVQVRIGDGLTEQCEWYDITDVIINNASTIPASLPFTLDDLVKAWFTNSEEFFIVKDDIYNPCTLTHTLLNEKPEDWDTAWFKYEYKVGDDYVFLPSLDNLTIGFESTDGSYMGPYYKPTRQNTFDAVTFSELRVALNEKPDGNEYAIMWRRPTNRITLDLDPNTLAIEDGKLTVLGGTGSTGGDGKPGRNIRVIDTRGIYFDTIPEEIDPDTGLPKYFVDEVYSLGPGLKITGAGVVVPHNMTLYGYIASAPVSSKRATYTSLLVEMWDNMTFGEQAVYFEKYMYKFGLNLPNPTGQTHAVTFNKFRELQNAIRERIKLMPYTATGQETYTQEDLEVDFKLCADECQTFLTNTPPINTNPSDVDPASDIETYGDANYNIKSYTYLKSSIRPYLAMSLSDVRESIWNVWRGITQLLEGTGESLPTDNDKLKIMQYFYTWYGMGSVGDVDAMYKSDAVWNQKLPYLNLGHIWDPFPLDWAFSFFSQIILHGGEWRKIAAGSRYQYTQLTTRPVDWDQYTNQHVTNSLNYFYHDNVDGIYVSNNELAMVPEYVANAYWSIQFQSDVSGWKVVATPLTNAEFPTWSAQYLGCGIHGKFRLLTSDTAPLDWEFNNGKYFMKDYSSHADEPTQDSALLLQHIYASIPAYEANKYYEQTDQGDLDGYVVIHKRVAYNSDELGTVNNQLRAAPVFEENTYYSESGGTYTLLDTIPNDWYTDFNKYYVRVGDEEPYQYDQVVGVPVVVYAYAGPYYSQSIIPET